MSVAAGTGMEVMWRLWPPAMSLRLTLSQQACTSHLNKNIANQPLALTLSLITGEFWASVTALNNATSFKTGRGGAGLEQVAATQYGVRRRSLGGEESPTGKSHQYKHNADGYMSPNSGGDVAPTLLETLTYPESFHVEDHSRFYTSPSQPIEAVSHPDRQHTTWTPTKLHNPEIYTVLEV